MADSKCDAETKLAFAPVWADNPIFFGFPKVVEGRLCAVESTKVVAAYLSGHFLAQIAHAPNWNGGSLSPIDLSFGAFLVFVIHCQ